MMEPGNGKKPQDDTPSDAAKSSEQPPEALSPLHRLNNVPEDEYPEPS